MTSAEMRIWEAAEREAARAPEIQPGSDLALDLQRLFADFPERVRERRAHLDESRPNAA
ncbi:hypothetical protein [Thermomonospora umbrina]|uniref:Uncharacterized protein n=1 Tax=Thermomonospora umbrina TaxID=111806 RepID=A0A3D9SWB9_9ACTN|nr:hypothetical protein [Thermomonospora umbrina]REF00237.1 hypothetical protein DFJ69_5765 [Thermomonospora umbrina]